MGYLIKEAKQLEKRTAEEFQDKESKNTKIASFILHTIVYKMSMESNFT